MIAILNGIEVGLTVEEFLELCGRTNIFGKFVWVPKIVEQEEAEEKAPKPVEESEKPSVDTEKTNYINSEELAKLFNIKVKSLYNYRSFGMPYVAEPFGKKVIYKYDKDACLKWHNEYFKKGLVKPDNIDGLIGTTELARELGICESSIYVLRKAGMPCTYINTDGKRYVFRYDLDECKKWYQEYRNNNNTLTNNSKKKKSKPEAVPVSTDYALWKAELNRICSVAGKDVGKMLSLTYKYMTKTYGIVWEQVEKDYFKANGFKPHSTSQAAYWMEKQNPVYANLTAVCLHTIISQQEVA